MSRVLGTLHITRRRHLWVSCCPGDGERRILFWSTVTGKEQVMSKKIVAPAYVMARAADVGPHRDLMQARATA